MAATSQNGFHSSDLEGHGTDTLSDSEYLELLGKNLRSARAKRGLTRKALAADSGVSERFLAQLETGSGNASVLVLRQIARSLEVPLEAFLTPEPQHSLDLQHAVEFLRRLNPQHVARARQLLAEHFSNHNPPSRSERLALVGLRGAGKSTVGRLLADKLGVPFFELDRLVEQSSGLSLSMIFDLYGQPGFRRFERQCLDDLLRVQPRFVVATGGSLVSEPMTYRTLLSSCYTIWLRATPEEHMSRVIDQGDMRPMAHNPEAMSDLQRILAEREQLYRKADVAINTSKRLIEQVVAACVQHLDKVQNDRAGILF